MANLVWIFLTEKEVLISNSELTVSLTHLDTNIARDYHNDVWPIEIHRISGWSERSQHAVGHPCHRSVGKRY